MNLMDKVFFGRANFFDNGSLEDLGDFMLTSANWEKRKQQAIDQMIVELQPSSCDMQLPPPEKKQCIESPMIVVAPIVAPKNINTRFTPRQKDSIFWCIHEAINLSSKSASSLNHINVMMNEKKAMADFFNQNPNALKNSNHKITLAKINEIRCNLMTKPVMDSVESFLPCSIFYKRNIFVHFETIHSYMKFADKTAISDDPYEDLANSILVYANGGRYELETSKDKVADFLQNIGSLFYLQHYEKVMVGAGNYKTDELRDIYKTVFAVDEDPNFKKPEYYEKILVKCFTTVNENENKK
jgi:hypothetical protein